MDGLFVSGYPAPRPNGRYAVCTENEPEPAPIEPLLDGSARGWARRRAGPASAAFEAYWPPLALSSAREPAIMFIMP